MAKLSKNMAGHGQLYSRGCQPGRFPEQGHASGQQEDFLEFSVIFLKEASRPHDYTTSYRIDFGLTLINSGCYPRKYVYVSKRLILFLSDFFQKASTLEGWKGQRDEEYTVLFNYLGMYNSVLKQLL